MAMEVGSKRLHKSATPISILALALVFGVSYMTLYRPNLSSQVARAMFTQTIHIVPNKKGLASIEVGNISDSGMGDTVHAGDRLHMQMNLISASEKSN